MYQLTDQLRYGDRQQSHHRRQPPPVPAPLTPATYIVAPNPEVLARLMAENERHLPPAWAYTTAAQSSNTFTVDDAIVDGGSSCVSRSDTVTSSLSRLSTVTTGSPAVRRRRNSCRHDPEKV